MLDYGLDPGSCQGVTVRLILSPMTDLHIQNITSILERISIKRYIKNSLIYKRNTWFFNSSFDRRDELIGNISKQ